MIDKNGRQLTQKEIVEKGVNRVNTVVLEFEVFLLHIVGYFPSHLVRKFFYRIAGIKIGSNTAIHTGARFYNPENIEIGTDTIIGENVVLDGRSKLTIGNHVDIASGVMIYNAEHDIESPDFLAVSSPVEIEDYVFIGPRSIILPGVKLGKGSVVAAGAVVTKNVDSFKIVGGVPAKEIGERTIREPHYLLGRAAWFR